MKNSVFLGSLVCILIILYFDAFGNNNFSAENKMDSLLRIRKSREVQIVGKVSIFDVKTPIGDVEKLLYIPSEHPSHDSVPTRIYSQIKERKHLIAKDSLLSADLFWVLRPYLLWLENIDPHLRVEPQPIFASYTKGAINQANNLPVPGFLMLNINDTLIVNRSQEPLFRNGDQIMSINNIPMSEYLEYCYNDRHIQPFVLLSNYFYEIVTAPEYKISLRRNGQTQEITTSGTSWSKAFLAIAQQQEFITQFFAAEKTGYFMISKFYPDNSLLINRLRKAIVQAKKQGCKSFILDLRGNPGGNGGSFDKLLSLFINKSAIPYMKSQSLKVTSESLRDYNFLQDSMRGKLIKMPDANIIKEISLDSKMYIPGMQYYVLMDKDTGSIAASFCNIMQYNGAAKLAGEALRHNALKYGEVVKRWLYLTYLMMPSISTMEFDEYTKAVDGVLMPDIPIPYVAADYASGEDGVLAKLLEIIKLNPENFKHE